MTYLSAPSLSPHVPATAHVAIMAAPLLPLVGNHYAFLSAMHSTGTVYLSVELQVPGEEVEDEYRHRDLLMFVWVDQR